jgi:ubiquinone/menaquinone biosynthesis C-methylase UbiE
MYVLTADSNQALNDQTALYRQHMEPMLNRLQQWSDDGKLPTTCPEFPQYLETCRWPFRQLEYSCAIKVLQSHLLPGQRYLDAGSGVTPLVHVFAAHGVEAHACDHDPRLIAELQHLPTEKIYGTHASYSVQDLTALSFPDEWFDAVTCISVLEHIAPPHDQQAIAELIRVLKPGGVLFLTVDFEPVGHDVPLAPLRRYVRRAFQLLRHGDVRSLIQSVARKGRAHRAARDAEYLARTPDQAYQIQHLEQDILPLLERHGSPSTTLPYSIDLGVTTHSDAVRFWHLVPGQYAKASERPILPAAYVLQKTTSRGHE